MRLETTKASFIPSTKYQPTQFMLLIFCSSELNIRADRLERVESGCAGTSVCRLVKSSVYISDLGINIIFQMVKWHIKYYQFTKESHISYIHYAYKI